VFDDDNPKVPMLLVLSQYQVNSASVEHVVESHVERNEKQAIRIASTAVKNLHCRP